MTKKPPKEPEKETKRKQSAVKLNTNLLVAVKKKKDAGPHFWKTLPRFIEDVLQEEIKEVDERAIVLTDNKKNNNNLKTNNWRFKEDLIEGPLSPHKSLVVEFWRGKAGSKNLRAWQGVEKGCLEILGIYGPDVLEDQIKLGIANNWKSISLANYERYKPIKRKEEKELDFEAMDNAPSLY